MEFIGYNGQIHLFDDCIIISRKGLLGFLTHGFKGEKTIPISRITAVQFKKAGVLNGYIQFTLPGGIESRRGVLDATKDENTVMFRSGNQARDFAQLRDILEERLLASQKSTSAAPSDAGELERFARLRDRGVITDEEFQTKKRQILGF